MYSEGALLPAVSKCCTLLLRQVTFSLTCLRRSVQHFETAGNSAPSLYIM